MSQWPVVVSSNSPAATKAVAGRLAALCSAGDVVLLKGDLGAGKTAFAQGYAAALGVQGPVTSPTFALVRQYRCADAASVDTLIHADVYRTGGLNEVLELGLAELVEERAVALVEWGELAAPALGDDALDILLEIPRDVAGTGTGTGTGDETADDGADLRTITISGRGRWSGRADDVAHAVGPVVNRDPS